VRVALDSDFRAELVRQWHAQTTAHTGVPATPEAEAYMRARFVKEVLETLYDESKFRGFFPPEQASIAFLGDAALDHETRMADLMHATEPPRAQ
jgi:hypothetical protein